MSQYLLYFLYSIYISSIHLQDDIADLSEEVAYTDGRSRNEELRCVLAVIRHGDRTPKQKLKVGAVRRVFARIRLYCKL